jgi:AcrR family transcriptional regulator
MARMNPNARRETIIAAAQAVAARKGLSATTVRDVAEEMETSSGLIHHYFASMDQLLAAVFTKVAEEDIAATRERMDRAESATGKLAAYFSAWADPNNDTFFQFWLDAWSEAGRNETIRERSRDLNIQWQSLLAEVIRQGIETGEFNDVEVDAVSWKALSLLDGLTLQVVAHPTVIERDKAAEWATRSVEQDLGLPLGALREAVVRA